MIILKSCVINAFMAKKACNFDQFEGNCTLKFELL